MTNRKLIMNFSADNEQGYVAFSKYYDAYKEGKSMLGEFTMSEANDKMLEFFASEVSRISGKKFSEYEPKQYCNFTDVREAAFAVVSVLTDLIIPDTLIKNFSEIADIKNVAWGDTVQIEMLSRDLFVSSKFGRGKRSPEILRQYNGSKTILPEMHALAVGVSLYDLMTGRNSLAEFVGKAALSIETEMRYDVWDTFITALGTLPSSGDAATNIVGYTQDSAIQLAQQIGTWNHAPAIFMGTKLACSKILPASTNYRYNLGDDYVKLGHVRDFFGTSVIELEQIADYATEFKTKLPNDKIFVLSPTAQKLLHIAIEGNTISKITPADGAADLISTGSIMKSWGVGVATSALAGTITLS